MNTNTDSFLAAPVEICTSYLEQHPELNIVSFQDRVNMILANGSVTYGPSILGRAHYDPHSNINLNTALGGNHNDVNQGMSAVSN